MADNAIPVPPGPVTYEGVNQLLQTAIALAFGPATIQTLVHSILERIDTDTAVQLFHPGVVISDDYDGSTHRATVLMDGDDQSNNTYAGVLIPVVLFPGQRVMVWYDLPHVAYVLGTTDLPLPPSIRLSDDCSGA